jgi:hypothetical protein
MFAFRWRGGRSRITLGNMPPGWSLRAIRFNGADVIDTGVELKPNENVRGLNRAHEQDLDCDQPRDDWKG